jgi:hypothetical protein
MDQFGARLIDGFKVASLCTPTVVGDLPSEAPPTWPANPQSYTSAKASYIDTLTIPPIGPKLCSAGHCQTGETCTTNSDCYAGPTCCKDFGAISRDHIEASTNHVDNALAVLADGLGALGIDIQATLTNSIQDGSLVLLLDHRDLDEGSLPDDFALAQFIGSFAPGTDYTIASAGNGAFYASTASFLPGTGEPRNWYQPALMSVSNMTAGPFALSLSLPFGFLTLDVGAEQAGVTGAPTISPGGVAYAGGKITGFILTDDIFAGLNLVLNSPTCACLGIHPDVYFKQPDGAWDSACISNASTLCPDMAEEVCVTLAGNNLLGSPPQVCGALPVALAGAADIDLNSDSNVYEAMTVGLQFTAKNGAFTVP